MKWTTCFFVRDLTTRRIVHHEIEEIDMAEMPANERARFQSQRIRELMQRYDPDKFEVFLQGFDSLKSLYSTWPQVAPKD
jgi:hypothetical protein